MFVFVQYPLLAFAELEFVDIDTRREARTAFRTGRTVQHILRTAKSLLGQFIIQPLRLFPLKRSKKLSFLSTF